MMNHNKGNRAVHEKKEPGDVVELENQFILRMPEEPARLIREAIRSGATSFKDRFTIQLDNDMRYGEVRVDHYLMHAKIVDLPTIVESLKTIDNKSFYKTADICQMMICKEEPDIPSTDDELPSKNKKKDPNKVDKKFLWPHGITPPTKNVRRRRFRKTLKKKYVEAPEIEKEVKRLLREDNDAVSVKWEIISEDDDQIKQDNAGTSSTNELDCISKDVKAPKIKSRSISSVTTSKHLSLSGASRDFGSPDESAPRLDLVEDDIFGGAVSDSEEEDTNINIDLDENSQLSVDDTTMNDSSHSLPLIPMESSEKLVTSFTSDMFMSSSNSSAKIDSRQGTQSSENSGRSSPSRKSDAKMMSSNPYGEKSYMSQETMKEITESIMNQDISQNALLTRIEELRAQLEDLNHQKKQKHREVANMENAALRQRFQEMLQSLDNQIQMKEMEYENLQSMLN